MSSDYAHGTIRDAICELAARPEGVSNRDLKDILGMPEGHVPPNMQSLEYQGRVLRAKADGHKLRWFKHATDRDAWLADAKAQRGTAAEVAAAALQARAAVLQARAAALPETATDPETRARLDAAIIANSP